MAWIWMRWRRRRRVPRGLRVAAPTSLLGVAAFLQIAAVRLEALAASPFPLPLPFAFRPALSRGPHPDAVVLSPDRLDLPVELVLRRGETLGQSLQRLGVESTEVAGLTRAMGASLQGYVDPRRLRPEDGYTAYFDRRGALAALEVRLAGRGAARLERDEAHWRGTWQPFERRVEERVTRGVLEESLDSSLRRAGGDPDLAYRMADVLQWDLDFNRDLQPGDRFEVLWEAVHVDGRFHEVGAVLALAYENRGRRLEAYRFGAEPGYYDGDGRPLQKLFLRSPLPYSRVTSRFSHRRFHPILKTYRPHYGVDYGAPIGTAVRATAAGVVSFAGHDGGGGGNVVKLRHANDYVTAYLHLSRFAPGVRAGKRVAQGEVIAFVGATGLATAPHLDYRVQHRGRWIDPLSLRSVPAEPVARGDLPRFLASRDRCRGALAAGPVPAMPAPHRPDLLLAQRPLATAEAGGQRPAR